MATPILNITELANGQVDQYITANEMGRSLEAAGNDFLSVDLSAGNVALTAAQYRGYVLFRSSGNAVARNLTLQAIKRLIVVHNNGTDILSVIVGSTTVAIPVAEAQLLYSDGTTNGLISIAGGAGGGGAAVSIIAPDTATTHTAVVANNGGLLIFNSASDCTITVPQTSTEALDAGFHLLVRNDGGGNVLVGLEGTDTLDGVSLWADPTQEVTIIKETAGSPNAWGLIGNNWLPSAVEDDALTAPPATPAVGAVYIPLATATGTWATHETEFAIHVGSDVYEFVAPSTGVTVYEKTSAAWVSFDGTNWVSAGAGGYTHPNHSGDVTSVGDGAQTIVAGAVTYAKMQDISATARVLGRNTAGAGDAEEITEAQFKTLFNLEIGTDVQAYDATTVLDADVTYELLNTNGDVGTTAGTLAIGDHLHTGVYEPADATIVKDADIGVTVQGYDATYVVDADIGVSVQGYDADTAKYDAVTANFTGTLQNGGSNVLVDTDISSTVQPYNATTVLDADVTYELLNTNGDVGTGAGQLAIGDHLHTGVYEPADATIVKDADIGVTVQAYDVDTAKLDVVQSFTAEQTFKEYAETQYSLTGTDIDPANGSLQYKTLSANTTFTESMADGQSVTLMINDGTAYTATWPTTTWVGGAAPTLPTTGYAVIELWQINAVLYGLHSGDA